MADTVKMPHKKKDGRKLTDIQRAANKKAFKDGAKACGKSPKVMASKQARVQKMKDSLGV